MASTSRYFLNSFNDHGHVEISRDLFKSRTLTCIDHILKNLSASYDNCDGGLYVGAAGVAYAFYYIAKCGQFHSESKKFLDFARAYINASLDYYEKNKQRKKHQVSFLLDVGGVYAVAALIYFALGNQEKSQKFLEEYTKLASACEPLTFLSTGSDELFVGRAGYLLGLLLLQRDLKIQLLNEHEIDHLCCRIVESGRYFRSRLRVDIDSPLMYAYHGTLYLGSGHGIAGILQVLLTFPSFLSKHPDLALDIQKTVDYMLNACMIDGNVPPDLEGVFDPERTKMLVHWCHGAAGVIYTFARAYLVFGKDEKYLNACRTLAETVWKKGLLKKGPGICHGVAGNGYVFLLMYRLTGEEKYLYRAERFASFIFTDIFNEGARTPDNPFSLFEGLAGTVCFLNDMLQPDQAEYPFSNIFMHT